MATLSGGVQPSRRHSPNAPCFLHNSHAYTLVEQPSFEHGLLPCLKQSCPLQKALFEQPSATHAFFIPPPFFYPFSNTFDPCNFTVKNIPTLPLMWYTASTLLAAGTIDHFRCKQLRLRTSNLKKFRRKIIVMLKTTAAVLSILASCAGHAGTPRCRWNSPLVQHNIMPLEFTLMPLQFHTSTRCVFMAGRRCAIGTT